MKLRMISIAALFSLVVAAPSLAQCCGGAKAKGDGSQQAGVQVSQASAQQADGQQATCHGDKASLAAKKDGCTAGSCASGAMAAGGMPKIVCHVGDKTVNCPMEAEKLAKADNAKITYVVAEKEYSDKMEALQAYAKVLEDHLGAITNVRYAVGEKCVNCPIEAASLAKANNGTVKYQVALVSFATQGEAEQAVKLARTAAEKVTMKKFVDGKEVACEAGAKGSCTAAGAAKADGCCEKSGANATATKSDAKDGQATVVKAKSDDSQKSCCASGGQLAAGSKTEFAVGEMRTPCPVTARVQLAAARIMAAQKAVQEFAAQKSGDKVALGN